MSQELGGLLRHARQRRSIGRTDLARRIGVSHPQIGQWERGKTRPIVQHLRSLAVELTPDLTEYGEWCRLRLGTMSSEDAAEAHEWLDAHPYNPDEARVSGVTRRDRGFHDRELGRTRTSEPDAVRLRGGPPSPGGDRVAGLEARMARMEADLSEVRAILGPARNPGYAPVYTRVHSGRLTRPGARPALLN